MVTKGSITPPIACSKIVKYYNKGLFINYQIDFQIVTNLVWKIKIAYEYATTSAFFFFFFFLGYIA